MCSVFECVRIRITALSACGARGRSRRRRPGCRRAPPAAARPPSGSPAAAAAASATPPAAAAGRPAGPAASPACRTTRQAVGQILLGRRRRRARPAVAAPPEDRRRREARRRGGGGEREEEAEAHCSEIDRRRDEIAASSRWPVARSRPRGGVRRGVAAAARRAKLSRHAAQFSRFGRRCSLRRQRRPTTTTPWRPRAPPPARDRTANCCLRRARGLDAALQRGLRERGDLQLARRRRRQPGAALRGRGGRRPLHRHARGAGLPSARAVEIETADLLAFCDEGGHALGLVPADAVVVPPRATVETFDWKVGESTERRRSSRARRATRSTSGGGAAEELQPRL